MTYQQKHASILKKILGFLTKDAQADFAEFAAQFYAKVPVSDLSAIDPQTAIDLAKSAFEFMKKRDGVAPKIRIFVPEKQTHGYDGRHTVIELLNDDMPFLVDSLTAELNRRGFKIYETIHPIFRVTRDARGNLVALGEKGTKQESLIHFEVSSLPEDLSADTLETDLEWVLQHTRVSVEDWKPILQKALDAAEAIKPEDHAMGVDAAKEIRDFLLWLADRNFVFLGYAEYDFFDEKRNPAICVVPDSRLGVLRVTDEVSPNGLEALPEQARQFLLLPQPIEVTKSNRRSLVHRPVPMDYIGLKRFDDNGNVVGEARFLGLFTSNVYYQSTEAIPLLRRKVARVLSRSDFEPSSHDGKSLKTILEFLPRDELFQMSEDDLFETSMGILALEAKPSVRIFTRKDAFERFISAMIFVPRERFSTELRRQIQELVENAFNGTTNSFATQITEAPLARLHLIVRTSAGEIPAVQLAQLEQEIAKRAYLWSDLLQEQLTQKHGDKKAEKFYRSYVSAFPQNYINRYDVGAAIYDIEKIETAQRSRSLSLELYRNRTEGDNFFHLKIYNPNEEIALSDILPTLEHAGFRVIDEHPYLITPEGNTPVWIRDFRLQSTGNLPVLLEQVKPMLEEALLSAWHKDVEDDLFNALILKAGLHVRQVVMLRAYAKYLRQLGFAYSQSAIEQAFITHPTIVKNIVALFEARFDIAEADHAGKQAYIMSGIDQQLSQVSNAAHDRILRRYTQLIAATLRTNYFQTTKDGAPKPVLSFKFNSHMVPDMPRPVPYAEIFVYSPRVEGIHLRGGKVARGGLRWSDRPEDFRTEVLGLMKAQMVKNSVIVPVGSKGGFVVKRPPAARDAYMAEGVECYKLYLSGLLDLTDNIVAGKIAPPAQLVRHDGDDPYLVVAADKGTATFSDTANGVSAAYGFWLGDAFASGGSAGYDHKKMAITARGAFVSVRRHFEEMGLNINTTPFTVVGIGDMAGDVFGNGMLLSDNIRLVAAFNHMHIFLDPNPDEKKSFNERKRMFNLPRSTWADYDSKTISLGGGIYERSAKSITISAEAAAALGTATTTFTPDELVRTILLAPVDLLWNGGIGTYVKAEDESHEQVGDRANNAVRVNGRELRCKLVGEGGNLGFTQKGRIEYARSGGRINTDAIDNSAGVDCSDHEVNMKIAFSGEVSSGRLSLEKRDTLLAGMTDDVAGLVLKDNVLQTLAITVAQAQGVSLLESHARLMQRLEKQGLLDRAIEYLPTDKQIADLKALGKGLSRPELAVLLSYSKMVLYKDILESSLPDDAYFMGELKRYFPRTMTEEFMGAISAHPLKREIIATVVTNSLVNRGGISFAFDLVSDLSVSVRDVAAAYAIVRDAFSLRELWKGIESLASSLSLETQAQMYAAIQQFLERSARWLLKNVPLPLDVSTQEKELRLALADMEGHKDVLHTAITQAKATALFDQLKLAGVPAPLADKIANLEMLSAASDIVAVARSTKQNVPQVGKVYFDIGDRLHFGWLRSTAQSTAVDTHWDRLAIQALLSDIDDEQRRLTQLAIGNAQGVEGWAEQSHEALSRYNSLIEDMQSHASVGLSRLLVALRYVKGL
jgi:glutamate dehydrogenase